MIRFCFFLMIISALLQCKSKDYLTPYDYDGRSISFGNGGGFTGKVTDFTLMDNGQIFQGANKEGNVNMIKKISKSEVGQIFNTYDVLGFQNMVVDKPGNMYFYVEMHDAGNNHKLIWGDHDSGETKELRVYHANLMRLVTKMTRPMPQKIQIK